MAVRQDPTKSITSSIKRTTATGWQITAVILAAWLVASLAVLFAPSTASAAALPVEDAVVVVEKPAAPPVLQEAQEVQEVPEAQTGPEGWQGVADAVMGRVNGVISSVFFFDVMFWDNGQEGQHSLPLVVAWLVIAAVFLTFRMGFINIRGFKHAINVTRGKYSDPDEPGEVSHFQALTTALSATVGLGNIAGVAIAIGIGGPGATFWLIVAGLLGMTTKMSECTLALAYRDVGPRGNVLGGPMQYLSKGLAEKGMAGFGKVLAVIFAILCIGGSMAGGNSFQVNQSLNAIQETFPFFQDHSWVYGLVMTFLTGIVIIGGIRRIANVADKIVPIMAVVYVISSLVVIFMNLPMIPDAFAQIFSQAFTPAAGYGGFIGVLVTGFQRAAFSNEAGAGSAPIAHAAAKTKEPVREGVVALLEPFIDTVVICTMTALVIIISGAYNNPAYADIVAANQGAALTSRAFSDAISFFPYVLSIAVFLFAYSTMISWSYYGERSAVWLFGAKASTPYKVIFLAFAFLGSILTATNVLAFGDLMILGMAFPNLLGVYILSGKVRKMLDEYWAKYKGGEFKVYD